MYAKRIQIVNYGPIDRLDITFPFDGDRPKPIVLVGENGSGKSILLSHIVNGLIQAKAVAFPETPEVEPGKAFKLRSSTYIGPQRDYSFSWVDFDDDLHIGELRLRKSRNEHLEPPAGILESPAEELWHTMSPDTDDHVKTNILQGDTNEDRVKKAINAGCVLYFPFNRSEDPAWLNLESLTAHANYTTRRLMLGQTNRRILSVAPLHDNQDWLFDVIYDRAAFELQTQNVNLPVNNGDVTIPLPVFSGYSGDAARIADAALQLVRSISRRQDVRFGIGRRRNRAVAIMSDSDSEARQIVPNIFQLSSGETSLLNLFLSILRDYDLSNLPFSNTSDVRGIVVVDEIGLHLHALHQHEVLPALIKMFPNVQFVVTTHSPLFVLGMAKAFGEEGVAVYRMPQGERINPEEFSEFGAAYQALAETDRYRGDIRTAIEKAQKPIVFVEGATGKSYVRKAAGVLGREELLNQIVIEDGGGADQMRNFWKNHSLPLSAALPQRVMLLFDCDRNQPPDRKGTMWKDTIPLQQSHPIQSGIENLFPLSTIQRARQHKGAMIDVQREHEVTTRGISDIVPEKWTVNQHEKSNLCQWICDEGNGEDFRHFEAIFDIIQGFLDAVEEGVGAN